MEACGSRRARPMVATVAFALALGSAACGGGADASDDVSVDDLGELALAEELRVGSVDDPQVGFSQIADIVVGEDGTMYVLERQGREVRVYAPDGTLTRRFGRQGDGPGELRNPAALGLLGDTLAVTDVDVGGRITFFHTSGDLVRAVRVPPLELQLDDPRVRVSARPFRMRPDGRFDPQMNIVRTPGASERPDPPSVPRIVFDREGRPADTTGWSPLSFPPSTSVGGVTVNTAPLLTDADLYAEIDGDSVIVRRAAATTPEEGVLTVTRLSPTGDTVFHRRLRHTPVAVTPAHRDSLIEERLGMYRNRPQVDVGAIRDALATELEWPAFHPPVRSVRVAKDGALWLLVAEGADARWLVLNADGGPRGMLTLPSTLTVHESDGDLLWGVEHDEVEVPWLVRYRLEGM